MNILIVFAHPEPKSFNGQLVNTASKHLTKLGHHVVVSDLFKDDFKCHADLRDFPNYSEDFFDLQLAQQQSQRRGQLTNDIKREQDRLLWADLIIFQFPLWWYSVPAPLKGYIDRVFSVGFAYGGANALSGKRVLISTTTGAPKEAWNTDRKGTIEQVLFPITHGTFSLLKLHVEEPIVVYGAKKMNSQQKEIIIDQFKSRLTQVTTNHYSL